jgi:hypothetical protein
MRREVTKWEEKGRKGVKSLLLIMKDLTIATVQKGKSKNIPQKMACMKAGHYDSSYFASTGNRIWTTLSSPPLSV